MKSPNVKEHAPPLAGAHFETRVGVHNTGDVADKAASGGCCGSPCLVLRLVCARIAILTSELSVFFDADLRVLWVMNPLEKANCVFSAISVCRVLLCWALIETPITTVGVSATHYFNSRPNLPDASRAVLHTSENNIGLICNRVEGFRRGIVVEVHRDTGA